MASIDLEQRVAALEAENGIAEREWDGVQFLVNKWTHGICTYVKSPSNEFLLRRCSFVN